MATEGQDISRRDQFLKDLRFNVCPQTGVYVLQVVSQIILAPSILNCKDEEIVEEIMAQGTFNRKMSDNLWTDFVKTCRDFTREREN